MRDRIVRDPVQASFFGNFGYSPHLPQENPRPTANIEQANRGATMLSYVPNGVNGRPALKIGSVMLKVPDRAFKPGRSQTTQKEEGRRIRVLIQPELARGGKPLKKCKA